MTKITPNVVHFKSKEKIKETNEKSAQKWKKWGYEFVELLLLRKNIK